MSKKMLKVKEWKNSRMKNETKKEKKIEGKKRESGLEVVRTSCRGDEVLKEKVMHKTKP